MKEIIVVGLNHRSAPVEIREKLAIPGDRLREILQDVYDLEGVSGCMILSTCNRVEYILHADQDIDDTVKQMMAGQFSMDLEKLESMIYVYRQDKAIRHVFRVASSLDSMVLGEPQIVGQVKEAFYIAFDRGVTDTLLNELFQRAIMVSKKVRVETGIGEMAVSVSFAAVEIARKIFGKLADKCCMLIGAGEMCELAAKHLSEQGAEPIIVLNRTLSRAEELAASFGGIAHPLSDLETVLPDADVVISSTGSEEPILTRAMLEESMKKRRRKPQLIVDIAVPRDVAEDARDIDQLYLYDIDDLKDVVDANMKERQRRAKEAETLVTDAVDHFMDRLARFSVAPAIQELRGMMESVRQRELEKCLRSMGDLNEDQVKMLNQFSNSLLNKFLHHPITEMKHVSGEEHALKMIRRIFGLKEH